MTIKKYNLALSILFAATGVIFIWIVYSLKAEIFTEFFDKKEERARIKQLAMDRRRMESEISNTI